MYYRVKQALSFISNYNRSLWLASANTPWPNDLNPPQPNQYESSGSNFDHFTFIHSYRLIYPDPSGQIKPNNYSSFSIADTSNTMTRLVNSSANSVYLEADMSNIPFTTYTRLAICSDVVFTPALSSIYSGLTIPNNRVASHYLLWDNNSSMTELTSTNNIFQFFITF